MPWSGEEFCQSWLAHMEQLNDPPRFVNLTTWLKVTFQNSVSLQLNTYPGPNILFDKPTICLRTSSDLQLLLWYFGFWGLLPSLVLLGCTFSWTGQLLSLISSRYQLICCVAQSTISPEGREWLQRHQEQWLGQPLGCGENVLNFRHGSQIVANLVSDWIWYFPEAGLRKYNY